MFCSKWSIIATAPLVVIHSNAVAINMDLTAPDLDDLSVRSL